MVCSPSGPGRRRPAPLTESRKGKPHPRDNPVKPYAPGRPSWTLRTYRGGIGSGRRTGQSRAAGMIENPQVAARALDRISATLSTCTGYRSAGTPAEPIARKTWCLAQPELSPWQYWFFRSWAVAGLEIILSLKNGHLGRHSQSAIQTSWFFSAAPGMNGYVPV